MTPQDYMKVAMEEVEVAIKNGERPFGAVVADNKTGEIFWKDHPHVNELTDPTAHAEISAIRGLCKKMNTLNLKDYTFYTTSEPCITCLSAMIKAEVSAVCYGAKTESTASLPIPAKELAKRANYPIKITGGILEEECLQQRENATSSKVV